MDIFYTKEFFFSSMILRGSGTDARRKTVLGRWDLCIEAFPALEQKRPFVGNAKTGGKTSCKTPGQN